MNIQHIFSEHQKHQLLVEMSEQLRKLVDDEFPRMDGYRTVFYFHYSMPKIGFCKDGTYGYEHYMHATINEDGSLTIEEFGKGNSSVDAYIVKKEFKRLTSSS